MKKTVFKNFLLNFIVIGAALIFISCSENSIEPESDESIEVEIRMEVQILDTLYQMFSRPYTQIYFTTYKLNRSNEKIGLERSDTTSCPNGWGVKIVNYNLQNKSEKIVLGAACESYDGKNYREVLIDYSEAAGRTDENNKSSVKKTFAIYYK